MIGTTMTVGSLTIPRVGVGTWPLDDEAARRQVGLALGLGYRAVDTAVNYDNETGVGAGIRDSGIPRDEVALTTKLDGRHPGVEADRGIDESLARLGTDHVDLLLIHWPLPARDHYLPSWRAFIDIRRDGRAREIGVSNFRPAHLERVIAETGVVPVLNQIELNPYVRRRDHVAFHREAGIVTAAWSPLGAGNGLLEEEVVVRIARRLGRSPAQVVLRWHLEQGHLVTPKATTPARLAENLAVFDFALTADDHAAIDTLDRGDGAGVDSDVFGH